MVAAKHDNYSRVITKNLCLSVASIFESQDAWALNSPETYKFALENHWLDECSAHMTDAQLVAVNAPKEISVNHSVEKSKKTSKKTENNTSFLVSSKRCNDLHIAQVKLLNTGAIRFVSLDAWCDLAYESFMKEQMAGLIPFLAKKRFGHATYMECEYDALSYGAIAKWKSLSNKTYLVAKKNGWLANIKDAVSKPKRGYARADKLYSMVSESVQKSSEITAQLTPEQLASSVGVLRNLSTALSVGDINMCAIDVNPAQKSLYVSDDYSISRILDVASRYQTLTHWKESDDALIFDFMLQSGLVEVVKRYLGTYNPEPVELEKVWTYHDVCNVGRFFENEEKWAKNAFASYSQALCNGWFERIATEIGLVKSTGKFSFQDCVLAASKCETLAEFKSKNSGMRYKYDKYRWIEILHLFLKSPGSQKVKMSQYPDFDTVAQAAQRVYTITSFRKHFSEHYEYAAKKNLLTKMILATGAPAVKEWSSNLCLWDRGFYSDDAEWERNSPQAYNAYSRIRNYS